MDWDRYDELIKGKRVRRKPVMPSDEVVMLYPYAGEQKYRAAPYDMANPPWRNYKTSVDHRAVNQRVTRNYGWGNHVTQLKKAANELKGQRHLHTSTEPGAGIHNEMYDQKIREIERDIVMRTLQAKVGDTLASGGTAKPPLAALYKHKFTSAPHHVHLPTIADVGTSAVTKHDLIHYLFEYDGFYSDPDPNVSYTNLMNDVGNLPTLPP